ncbi:hypothetical protein DFQ27_008484 [Actinomortierella ambigua]|uniref:Chitin-binding type-4 domain-containing protein n=1 Tax=Actinomortierella ambigua TaxID=1343610 RepID=A0A9P6TYE2_9FUNG|nr:hypothetical protein DFQ27_008484 [Actinomortierella ambigua]
MLFKTSFIAAAFAAIAALTAEAHVALREPCPRYGSYAGCPAPPSGQSVDYNIRAPIGVYGSANQPLCKRTVPFTSKLPTYKAGQTINVKFDIGASHGGGHCQFALSYDGGKKWVNIKEIVRECLRGNPKSASYSIPVKIPDDAPSGRVVFQWLWNNAIGNRELYSNCVDMQIQGTNGGTLTGKEPVILNYGPNSQRVGEFPNASDKDGREHFTSSSRKSYTFRVPASK